jgi:hypothetical protein
VALWSGVGLVVAGGAAALVAWLGFDRANAYLGVPAAVAALVGLATAVYGLTVEGGSAANGPGRVRQRARASGRGRVRQAAGDQQAYSPGRGAAAPAIEADQWARARGDGWVEQVGGNQTSPDRSGDS